MNPVVKNDIVRTIKYSVTNMLKNIIESNKKIIELQSNDVIFY